MKLSIYGSGCSKCKKLTANAEAAAQHLNIAYELEKVTDVNAIIDAGVLRTPALGVDDRIRVEGKIPSVEDLEQILEQG